ncbi:ras-GEF domain-containing protein [Favolaschia claudopus]|uniref:Ras-GEF domain-containing protein n=1 Tax=Favolaschia claudopus TaxID=2862362 RepID=A0AAV9ZX74_9AGAR
MSPRSHFIQYFPLVASTSTRVYAVLFYQSVNVLVSRRRPHYRYHLACMSALFLLSTIHISLAYTWAFITDTADTAIYELFSLKNPLPTLYMPDDPVSVHRIGILLKLRFSLTNAIADGIIIYRCYVIWGRRWQPVSFLIVAYIFTCIGAILGLLPLSGTSERAAMAVCIGSVFVTNVLGAGLAAGRIWWISRRAVTYLGRRSRKKYLDLTAILLESGLMYPVSLAIIVIVYLIPATPTVSVLVCLASCYHIAGIAPTLIIVRVGLGTCVTISRTPGTSEGLSSSTLAARRRQESTLELDIRVTKERSESTTPWNDSKFTP